MANTTKGLGRERFALVTGGRAGSGWGVCHRPAASRSPTSRRCVRQSPSPTWPECLGPEKATRSSGEIERGGVKMRLSAIACPRMASDSGVWCTGRSCARDKPGISADLDNCARQQ